MHQRLLRIVRPKGIEDFRGCSRGRKRKRSACERFGERDDVGRDLCLLARKHRSRTTEAGKNFVKDQERIMFVREPSQMTEHVDVVEFHPARALNQWFDDDSSNRIALLLKNVFQSQNCRSFVRRAKANLFW